MIIDMKLVQEFEAGLNTRHPEQSDIPAELIGYGEISAIYKIGDDSAHAYKRMPLFSAESQARVYERQYHEYCGLLEQAGLTLPQSETCIVQVPGKPLVLYIAQEMFDPGTVAHKIIHGQSPEEFREMLGTITGELEKIWAYNQENEDSKLAIDGQLSNWVLEGDTIYYIDTSTPLYHKDGKEQLDPELLLQAVPSFLLWLVRMLFVDDVMTRYYDPRQVYTDIAANLYKEQVPQLIPEALGVINGHSACLDAPLEEKEAEKYYRQDKFIWSSFLALRKLDRFIKTRILGKNYEFILPGKIER